MKPLDRKHIPHPVYIDGRTLCGIPAWKKPLIAEKKSDMDCEMCRSMYGKKK